MEGIDIGLGRNSCFYRRQRSIYLLFGRFKDVDFQNDNTKTQAIEPLGTRLWRCGVQSPVHQLAADYSRRRQIGKITLIGVSVTKMMVWR